MTLGFWPGQQRGSIVGLFIRRDSGGKGGRAAFAGKDELMVRHTE